MLATIGVALGRQPVPRCARQSARLSAPIEAARTSPARWRSSATHRSTGRARTSPPAAVPSFLGAGAYRHHVPASVDHLIQRSRVPDQPTRPTSRRSPRARCRYLFEFQTQVGAAHRHGGGQRLDVRRLHRLRRSRDDGPAASPAATRRSCPAACIRTTATSPSRPSPTSEGFEIVRLPAAVDAEGRTIIVADRRRDRLRRRAEPRRLRPSSRDVTDARRGRPRRGRAADRGRHRGGLARPARSRRARWAPTSSSPRASRSATR